MRLIDADKLLEKVLSIPPYCGHCDGYGFVQLDMVEDAIKDAPTIEAEPVKHGRWIKPTKINGRSFSIVHCSACGEVPCGVDEHTKFCPNCGTKMDLEGT